MIWLPITRGLRAWMLAKVSSWAVDRRTQHICRCHVCLSVLFEFRCMYVYIYIYIVYIPIMTGTTTTTTRSVLVCAKCTIFEKSGELSCCASGAAWFNNCGDDGDSGFDHTWLEGFQACEGTLTMMLHLIYIGLSVSVLLWICIHHYYQVYRCQLPPQPRRSPQD